MHKKSFCNCILRTCLTVCILSIMPMATRLRASAQTPSDNLAFEVATVKPVDPSHGFDGRHFWAHINAAGASYWSMTPVNLVTYAYGVELFQVTGPDWASRERFDIEARFPGVADKHDDRKMLQALLKDRFKLAFHIEERPLEGYVLVVGKNGEKLTPSPPARAIAQAEPTRELGDSNAHEQESKPKVTLNKDGSSTADMGSQGTQTMKFDQERRIMHVEVSRMTMQELAGNLQSCLGSGVHKVEDQTGIMGSYQLTYDCPLGTYESPDTDAEALPSAQREDAPLARSLNALGLKLEKRKFLQPVYVIDHVESPSAN